MITGRCIAMGRSGGVPAALVTAALLAPACDRHAPSDAAPPTVAANPGNPAPPPAPPPAAPPAPAPAPPPAPPPAAPPATAPAPPPATAPAPSGIASDSPSPRAEQGVRVFTERWPDGSLMREYQMRRGTDGKYHRNGFFRQFFNGGKLEREGTYRNDVRVGLWKMYNPDGTIAQEVDFGEGRAKSHRSAGDGAANDRSAPPAPPSPSKDP